MSETFNEKFNLLIIDPQNDFIDSSYPGSDFGRLAVVGASQDIPKISDLIKNHADKIDKIVVSMDTHTVFHIGHRFWRSVDDNTIAPGGTTFTIEAGNIKGSDGKTYEVNVKPEHKAAMNKYAKKYIETVINEGANDGRNIPCTWAVHCIQGTEGWKVHPDLVSALESVSDKVQYHIKGQNQLAEMYSIMKAEAPYEKIIEDGFEPSEIDIIKQYIYNPTQGDATGFEDVIPPNSVIENLKNFTPTNTMPSIGLTDNTQYNLQTTFNEELFNHLTADGANIVVCGEALSHCVQFSTRDIVAKIIERNMANQVYIIENASSPVNLDAIGLNFLTKIFKESADAFINDMLTKYNTGSKHTGVLSFNNNQLSIRKNEIPNVVKPAKVPAIPNYMKPTEASRAKQTQKYNKGGKRTRKNSKKSKKTRKHNKRNKMGGKRSRKN